MSLLLGIIFGIAAVIPLVIERRWAAALITSICASISFWIIFYLARPSLFVDPLIGLPLVFVAIFWLAEPAIIAMNDGEVHWGWVPFIVIALVYMFTGCSGCSMFRSSDYAKLIGDLEKRVWTQDIQPKDPEHIRLVTQEMAEWLADKQLGEAGKAIGSQFHVAKEYLTLQRINKELWYVAPLDFNGYTTWTSTKVSPGYVMVHAEDPHRTPIVITDQKFQYTPGAYWGSELTRFLRNNGYRTKGLTDFSFEIDEEGNPWWVITVYKPTIAWWGRKVSGVAIVNPTNGKNQFYPLTEVPDWVDRAIPADFIKSYIANWGSLSGGWWNMIWGKKELVEPEDPTIIYGSDNEPYWVTTITSTNTGDESLVGLIYTNARTGKSVEYAATGLTEYAIITAVNNQVAYKNWHGNGPVLYNIFGTMASIVPILGANHTFQSVAIVDVKNQQIVVENDIYSAYRAYEAIVRQSGQKISVESAYAQIDTTGVIDRIGFEIKGTNTYFYFHCQGFDLLFEGTGAVSPTIPVSRIGDRVEISYFEAPGVVPLIAFNNLSLPLAISATDSSLQKRVGERLNQMDEHEQQKTIEGEIKNMSPEELEEIYKIKKEQEKK